MTLPLQLGLAAGVALGADTGTPVMDDCTLPFALTGQVKKVLLDVSGEAVEDMESKMRMHLARR